MGPRPRPRHFGVVRSTRARGDFLPRISGDAQCHSHHPRMGRRFDGASIRSASRSRGRVLCPHPSGLYHGRYADCHRPVVLGTVRLALLALLLFKMAMVMLIVPLVWIEGNAALRAHLAVRTLSLLLGWLAWTLAFLGAFGCAVIWVFTDQRRRCPECLGRLALPVTLGSWASVFDPVTTEMLCDEGHGSL